MHLNPAWTVIITHITQEHQVSKFLALMCLLRRKVFVLPVLETKTWLIRRSIEFCWNHKNHIRGFLIWIHKTFRNKRQQNNKSKTIKLVAISYKAEIKKPATTKERSKAAGYKTLASASQDRVNKRKEAPLRMIKFQCNGRENFGLLF